MKVPVYDQPQAETRPLQVQVGVDPSALGTAGKALQQVGAEATDLTNQAIGVYKHEKSKADAEAVTNAETALQGKINSALSPNDGLMSLRGDAALQASGDVYQHLAKARDEIAGTLKSPDQQRLFGMRSNALLEEAHKSGETWVGHQRLAAQQASAEGLQSVSLDALANSYADPEQRARYIAQPEGSIRALALSPQDAEAKLAAWRQRAHTTVLNQFIANNDFKGAQNYLSQVQGELGSQSPQYEHTINTLKEKVVGDQTAISFVDSARLPNGFVDTAKAIQQLEKMPAGPEKEHTEQALSKYLSLEKAAESNQKSKVFDTAFSSFLKNHSLSDVPAATQSWLAQNDPEGWNRLEQLSKSWEKRDSKADEAQTANFITIKSDIEQNPLKYRDMSTEQFNATVAPLVSEADWKQLGNAFSQAKKTGDYQLKAHPAQVVNELVAKAFGKKGGPDKWDEQTQGYWRDIHDYVERQATQWSKDHNGKDPNDEQLEKWANDRLVKGTVVGGGFFFGDTTARRVEAEHKDRLKGKPFLEDIPGDINKSIRAKLQQRGVAKPSDEQVRAVYQRLKAAQ